MRFRDPSTFRCPSCGSEIELPVSLLLALTAQCPNCGASLNDTGLNMRRFIDEHINFCHAVDIIMHLENYLGIEIPDQNVVTGEDWSNVTLNDLAVGARRSMSSDSPVPISEAIHSAVRSLFPKASDKLDFTVPLREVTAPDRYAHLHP